MKIYFCDKCNESIPLKDIGSNRISIDAERAALSCRAVEIEVDRADRVFSRRRVGEEVTSADKDEKCEEGA